MTVSENRAVVFAYHDVGVRSLASLLACGIDVALVVTHDDNPSENIWFGSVEKLARLNDIPVIKPKNPNSDDVIDKIREYDPHWLFSFYYRYMLDESILELAQHGAYNLHGSLLPKYRGRVPINWAIIYGESQTGASLHRMVKKPDAGGLVDQEPVPILLNDTAFDVFRKVTCAAEVVLMRAIPKLLDGSATEHPMRLSDGSYFGGRKPEDGLVNWQEPTLNIHNFIRALAPPFPGAFFYNGDTRVSLLGSYYSHKHDNKGPGRTHVAIYWDKGQCWLEGIDGIKLCITQIAADDVVLDEKSFKERFGSELQVIPGADSITISQANE